MYKVEAVALVVDSGRSIAEVAKSLGIGELTFGGFNHRPQLIADHTITKHKDHVHDQGAQTKPRTLADTPNKVLLVVSGMPIIDGF